MQRQRRPRHLILCERLELLVRHIPPEGSDQAGGQILREGIRLARPGHGVASVDVIDDPILGRSLVALTLDEPLPKAIFYLIQRKDTALTPMSSYMAQLFRRYCQ